MCALWDVLQKSICVFSLCHCWELQLWVPHKNNIRSCIISSEVIVKKKTKKHQSSAFTIWSEGVPPVSSNTAGIDVCTILCSRGANLPLMKTFDSFSNALQSSPTHGDGTQLVLASLVNGSPIDRTPSSPGEQCERRTPLSPTSLPKFVFS